MAVLLSKSWPRYLLVLRRLPYRDLQLLSFPVRILNPFCPEQILLLAASLLLGGAGWLTLCRGGLCFADHKDGMSRRN